MKWISRWLVGRVLLSQARMCRERWRERERERERGCIKCHKTAGSENGQSVGEDIK